MSINGYASPHGVEEIETKDLNSVDDLVRVVSNPASLALNVREPRIVTQEGIFNLGEVAAMSRDVLDSHPEHLEKVYKFLRDSQFTMRKYQTSEAGELSEAFPGMSPEQIEHYRLACFNSPLFISAVEILGAMYDLFRYSVYNKVELNSEWIEPVPLDKPVAIRYVRGTFPITLRAPQLHGTKVTIIDKDDDISLGALYSVTHMPPVVAESFFDIGGALSHQYNVLGQYVRENSLEEYPVLFSGDAN